MDLVMPAKKLRKLFKKSMSENTFATGDAGFISFYILSSHLYSNEQVQIKQKKKLLYCDMEKFKCLKFL